MDPASEPSTSVGDTQGGASQFPTFQIVNTPVIKTEGKESEEAMETDIVDSGSGQLSDFAALENIDVELGKIQGAGDDTDNGGLGATTQVSTQTAVAETSLTTSNIVRMATSSVGLTQSAIQAGNIVTLQGNQVLLTRPSTQVGARTISAGDSTITKMIITKNTQQARAPGTNTVHPPTQVIVTSASVTSLLQPRTPTKDTYRVVMSNTGVFSPQKILTTPTTPTKQILPAGKVPISPMKSPPKITVVPIAKSPQKVGPPQIITMVGKSLVSGPGASTTVTMATSTKPHTFSMSPSKVIIKGQQMNMQPGVQQSLMSQQLSASALKSSSIVSVASVGGATSNVQPLTVSGNKFQYVRLVTTPGSQSQATGVKTTTIAPAPSVTMAKSAGNMGPIKIMPINPSQQQLGRPAAVNSMSTVMNHNQRIILPATSQVPIRPSFQPQQHTFAQIRPSPTGGVSNTLNQLPPGTTIISSGQNVQGVQGFALVPAQYVPQQLQQQFLQQHKQDNYVPISSSGPVAGSSHSRHNGASEPAASRPRKPCNCTKSQCLKLYCDCFANGEFCNDCNCMNCYNNLDHEEERGRAIKSCLERNPLAFHPKIGKGKGKGERDRRHNKGCNCKRSGCLKNYCECYEAKILCSALCKCCGCKNFEESPDRKTLMHLADAAEVRVQQQTAATTKLSSQIRDLPPRAQPSTTGERPAYTFVTTDVAEATCTCLIAQAEEAERTRQIEITQERMILEEFGRCLMQVIESANKTKLAASGSLP